MKAYPGQSGTGLVLYDAWAVPGVITDMCCLLKFTDHHPQPGPRLSTCGGSVDHLQRLGEKRSRKLHYIGQRYTALRRTSWRPWGPHSSTCEECGAQLRHVVRPRAVYLCELLLARTASCGNLNHF